MKTGRSSTYTPEIGIEICDKIASCSTGIKKLCKQIPHWPHPDTIYKWLKDHKSFSDLYAQAKREQVRALVDEILEISDDTSQDELINDQGKVVANSEYINRSRLRVDTRKWIAAKLVPRLYGDNVLARELSDEMDEFKRMIEENKRISQDGNIDHSEAKQDSKE